MVSTRIHYFLTKRAMQIKDLQAARGKTPFKTTADVDAHIRYAYSLDSTLPSTDASCFSATWKHKWSLVV